MSVHSSHPWRMRYLSGLQALILCCLWTFSVDAQSYQSGNNNYLKFRSKPIYYGMSLGGNSGNYKVFRSTQFDQSDSIRLAEGVAGPGFNVHVIGNLKIGEYFDFRFLPGFSFGERSLLFTDFAGQESRTKIESVFVELPFQLRYKSAPYKDVRIFVMSGIKYSWDVASNSRIKAAENNIVRISPTDFQFEVGAGFQIFTPFFIFSPEFKVSQGLQNILIFDDELEETKVLQKILSRAFTISINLEG